MLMYNEFSLSEVTLKDRYLVNAYNREVAYLLSLFPDRLLAGFRENAGIRRKMIKPVVEEDYLFIESLSTGIEEKSVDESAISRYPGWENSLIGGHTLGHYLTACVQAYESANASELNRRSLLGVMDHITSGLKECRDAIGTGFIFGAEVINPQNIEQQFDNVENDKTDIFSESWVPWYTLHKIFEGLVSLASLKSVTWNDSDTVSRISETAKDLASGLADWVYLRVSKWSPETRRTVLNIEYGGMNDCLYDVYLITHKAEHLEAAHVFDDEALFEKVLNAVPGDNILDNVHANTTIPKFIGAMKRYIVTDEEKYRDYAVAFFKLVALQHSYIIGNNSEWEHFGKDGILDLERTNCNCETCNAYNMLKLAKLLYEFSGDNFYADWYENTFINTILSSQNPQTGMTTYFQPMATGYFKTYSTPDTNFWCCTGSGMENFSKLGESFFFYSDDTLVINQYFSSSLNSVQAELSIDSTFPQSGAVRITFERDYSGRLALRIPKWAKDDAGIDYSFLPEEALFNSKAEGAEKALSENAPEKGIRISSLRHLTLEDSSMKGYAVLCGDIQAGDCIEISFPMHISAENLPDSPNTYAFKYGPTVLSARLGMENMVTKTTGVDVTIPAERLIPSYCIPTDGIKTEGIKVDATQDDCNIAGGIKTEGIKVDSTQDDCYTAGGDATGSDTIIIQNGLTVEEFIANIDKYMLRDKSSDALQFDLTGTNASLTFMEHFKQHKERYGVYFRFVSDKSLRAK